jgi:phenylpropionate dioxygenase-like ring-hydroxylating dioxygenase large terminal subunit
MPLQPSAQRDCVRRLLAHLASGTTDLCDAPLPVPADHFTTPEHLAREHEAVFRRQPTLVALSADLPDRGSFVPVEVAGVPLLIVRHRDDQIRAFLNGCRHRGTPLASRRGRAQGGTLQCPFHAWTYNTDGGLAAIPGPEEAFASCDREGLGLLPRPCLETDGLVFVRAVGEEPIDAEATLKGIGEDLRSLELARYHHFETRTTQWRCNWKLALATFLESYHVFSLHRETVDPWYLSHPMISDGWGPNLRFPVARRSVASLAQVPETQWRLGDHATLQWLVGATRLVTHTRDTALLWQFEALAPDLCEIRTSLYSTAQAIGAMWSPAPGHPTGPLRERLVNELALQLRVTGEEDFPAQEGIQRVLSSGQLPEVLFGRNEVAAVHFHRALAARLAAGEGGTSS